MVNGLFSFGLAAVVLATFSLVPPVPCELTPGNHCATTLTDLCDQMHATATASVAAEQAGAKTSAVAVVFSLPVRTESIVPAPPAGAQDPPLLAPDLVGDRLRA